VNDPAQTLPLRVYVGWGAGTFVTSILLYTTNTLLLRYLVDYVGIAAATAGTLIAAAKIFDAVIDPLIGNVSDRTQSRWGRRRPYLLVGTLLCAAILPLLFSVPHTLGGDALLVYVAALLLLYAAAWSLFNIPYLTMPAEMTCEPHERSRLIAWRVYASGVSVFLGSSAAPMVLQALGRTREAHGQMALALVPFVLVGGLAAFLATRHAPATRRESSPPASLAAQAAMLAGNPPLLSLIAAKFTMLLGTTAQAIVAAYFTSHVLGLSDYTLGMILAMSTVGLLASQPIWLAIGRRRSKRAVYFAAAAVTSLVGVSWLAASPGEPTALILLRGLVAGVGAGGMFLMSNSMLPDAVAYDFDRTGHRREGSLVALFAFAEQVAAAFAAGAVGWLLTAVGFVSATQGVAAAQDAQAIDGIRLAYALAPSAGLLSVFWLRWFRFDSGVSKRAPALAEGR
jgi:glycoside/pentoside/hexuronide:cation symporter, GPH family